MKIRTHVLFYSNGEMKPLVRSEKTYDILNYSMLIRRFYRKNPYAKRIDKNWICQDYRIDQQRPIRNVYSEGYLEIVYMTEMEEMSLNNMIKLLEKDRIYPFICPYCETENMKGNNYCIKCGNKLEV